MLDLLGYLENHTNQHKSTNLQKRKAHKFRGVLTQTKTVCGSDHTEGRHFVWGLGIDETQQRRLWVPTDYDSQTLSSINLWLWNVEFQQHMRHWVPTTHDYGTQQNMTMKVWAPTAYDYDTLSSNSIWSRDFELQQHMIMRLGVPTKYDYETWSSNNILFWDLEFQQHRIMNVFLCNSKSLFWFKMKMLFLSNIPGSASPTLM